MADTLEQLIMALAQADSAVAGSDPYASPQAAVENIKWDPTGYGVGENAAAAGIKGLLSGLFGQLGTDYKQRAADEYRQVLQGSFLGAGVPERKVLPEELFKKAQTTADLFSGLKALELKKQEDAARLESAKDAAKRAADLEDFYAKEQFKSALEGGSGKKQMELADSLRKELGSKKGLADFAEVKNRVQVLKAAKNDPTSVSDLDYIYAVAKVLDPASVVRESEAGLVIDSGSIPSSVLGYINKLSTGGQALDASKRDALFALVKRHYDSRAAEVAKELSRYEKIAKKRGLDIEDILPFSKSDLELDANNASSVPAGLTLESVLAEKARRSGGR